MEEMFLRLGFSQAVVQKLVEDHGIDYQKTLVSLSDEDIARICDMICRPGELVSGETPKKGNWISVLIGKILYIVTILFKTMKHCSKD